KSAADPAPLQLRLGLTTPAQRQHSVRQINSLRAERSRPRAARACLSILALSVARDRRRCRRQVRAAAQACNFSRLHARGATGAPRSISDALVAAVLAKTLHHKPPDAVRWSSRRLGATLGVSQRTVLRIWRTFGL